MRSISKFFCLFIFLFRFYVSSTQTYFINANSNISLETGSYENPYFNISKFKEEINFSSFLLFYLSDFSLEECFTFMLANVTFK